MNSSPEQDSGRKGPVVVVSLVIGAGIIGIGMLAVMLTWDRADEPDYEGQPTPGAVVFPPPIED